ncbi:nitrate/nitrite transporter [Stella sp.]|uniref:MFS transporter n=1 Tax=Stella sp. TaxID=2912054 RepID=UPI0035AE6F0D
MSDAVRIIAPFALAYFLSLFFRSINALIAPDLVAELTLGPEDLGLLTSMYFLAFALFQLPLGALLDRYGARRVQATLVTIAAAGATIIAAGHDLATVAAGRAMVGLGFAGGLMSAYKQMADWFPPTRLPLLNGLFLGFGSLGAVVATAPAELLIGVAGWRGLMLIGGGAALAAALALWLVVPERPRTAAPVPIGRQVRELFTVVYRDRLFWRLAPMTLLGFASGSAIQTLWAGPWLRDVAGFSRPDVATQLMVMALALSIGSALGGVVAEALRRHGIGTLAVAGGAAVLFMLAELGIVLEWIGGSAVLWAVFGATFNVITLTYAALSQHFGPAFAGRANTGMNVLSGTGAFLLQYAIGGVIGLWPQTAAGGYDPAGYRVAFAALLALQAAAFLWFLLAPRLLSPSSPAATARSPERG